MGRIIGYARVSTKGQAKDGNSIEVQENLLKNQNCNEIHTESYTGTKMERPVFTKILNELKEGDTLVVTKLDRFARTTEEGTRVVKELMSRGVKVHILNMGLIEDTPTGRLIFNIMLCFAEYERDMIVERTSEGRAVAKQNGVKFGRSKIDTPQMKYALELYEKGEMSVRKICEVTGVSKATLCRRTKELKDQEVLREVI